MLDFITLVDKVSNLAVQSSLLNKTQKPIFELKLRGLTSEEVGKKIGRSKGTIKSHVHAITKKNNTNSILECFIKMHNHFIKDNSLNNLIEKVINENRNCLFLTKRQSDILKLRMKGYLIKEISTKLFLSEKTIKFHITNVYKKYNSNNLIKCFLNMTHVMKEKPNISEGIKSTNKLKFLNKKEIMQLEEKFKKKKITLEKELSLDANNNSYDLTIGKQESYDI